MQNERIDRLLGYLGEISTFLSEVKFRTAENSENVSKAVERILDGFNNSPLHGELSAPMRNDVALQPNNKKDARFRLTFTKKELNSMPKDYKHMFAYDSQIIFYRVKPNGVYEVRYHRNGLHIEVSSKDPIVMKEKFIRALQPKKEEPAQIKNDVLFNTCLDNWLSIKKRTVKPSTFGEYERLVQNDIKPEFYGKYALKITREELQNYLFGYTDAGKFRTAEKIHLILRCVFDLISEDYDVKSPMRKIVLPYRARKKGSALTLEEERILIDYCISNKDNDVSSAILLMLYFGLRQSERASVKVKDDSITCVTSKLLMGKNEELRRIPFTPVFLKVAPYVDFEKASTADVHRVYNAFKKILPNHHPHELRYTYITRCKTCGVNPEIVMLWDGHEEDVDVRASKVDRGYTDFTWAFQLEQAKKVDYDV